MLRTFWRWTAVAAVLFFLYVLSQSSHAFTALLTPGLDDWKLAGALALLGAVGRRRQGLPPRYFAGLGLAWLLLSFAHATTHIHAEDRQSLVLAATWGLLALASLAAHLWMERWTGFLAKWLQEGSEFAVAVVLVLLLALAMLGADYPVVLATGGLGLLIAAGRRGLGQAPQPLASLAWAWMARLAWQLALGDHGFRFQTESVGYVLLIAAVAMLWERARAQTWLALLVAIAFILPVAFGGVVQPELWWTSLLLLGAAWLGRPWWQHLAEEKGESPWGAREAFWLAAKTGLAMLVLYEVNDRFLNYRYLHIFFQHESQFLWLGLVAFFLRRRLGRPWQPLVFGLAWFMLVPDVDALYFPLTWALGLLGLLQLELIQGYSRSKLAPYLPAWADGLLALALGALIQHFDSHSPQFSVGLLLLLTGLAGSVRVLALGKAPRYGTLMVVLMLAAVVKEFLTKFGLPLPLVLLAAASAFVLWGQARKQPWWIGAWALAVGGAIAYLRFPLPPSKEPLVLLALLVLGWGMDLALRREQARHAVPTGGAERSRVVQAQGKVLSLAQGLRQLGAKAKAWGAGRLQALKAWMPVAGAKFGHWAGVGAKEAGHLWADRRKRARVLTVAVLLLATLGGYRAYTRSICRVEAFTPAGEISNPRTLLQVRFSDEVRVSGDLSQSIKVTPPLAGRTYLADPRTLIFMPSEPLAPATRYQARFDSGGLSSSRWRIEGSASTAFETPGLKVTNLRLFFHYDLLGREEREMVGELDLNYPVDQEALKAALRIAQRVGSGLAQTDVPYTLEKGLLPTRFYFHVGGLKRRDVPQAYDVVIGKALSCNGCGRGLDEAYAQSLAVPQRPVMTVESAELNHLPGESLVAVRFSLPLAGGAKDFIRLEKLLASGKWQELPYKLETEYAYAVLRAPFEPNLDYRVKVLPGIAAATGQTFTAQIAWEYAVRLEDAAPYTKFKDAGHYLPLKGGKAFDVATRNLDHFQVTVEKIYRPNLVLYLQSNDSYRYGRNVATKEFDVQGGQLNEEVLTRVDMGEWLGQPHPGLFHLGIHGKTWDERDDTWILATDLGMVAKTAGKDLWVQVLSIGKLLPNAGVTVELLDKKNVVVARKTSDEHGRVFFPDWRNELEPFVVVASLGEDQAFLRLDQGGLDTSRFDTGGDPADPSGLDAFLTSERGLYRPGDEAHFTAVLRRADLEPARIGARLEVSGADGRRLASEEFRPDEEGVAVFRVPLPAALPTGQCSARLVLPNGVQLAYAAFKVEEFIPNKIRAKVLAPTDDLKAGGRLEYVVQANHLFGAPAVSLTVKTMVELVAKDFSHPDYPGYHFSDPERRLEADVLRVPHGETDHDGRYEVGLDIPASILPASMVQGRIYGEVTDSGGRPVGANARVDIHRYPYYLGIKLPAAVETGADVTVDWACVTPDGKPASVNGVPFTVVRKTWYTLFRRAGWGGHGFESASYDEVVSAKEVDLKGGRGKLHFKADKAGDYSIRLGKEEEMRTGLSLRVQGADPGSLAAASLPDAGRLALSFDKEAYGPGETARLKVRAPFAGRLLLSVEREKVFQSLEKEVPAGTSYVELPVTGELQPNAYATGLLVRTPSEELRDLPMVSFGVAPLMLDNRNRHLDLKWEHPAEIRSQQGLNVDIATEPGTRVVLAAVDSGILDIVNFETPDPFKHFYRKRGLSTQTFTLLDAVLPDLAKRLAAGGDEDEAFMARHLNPVAAKRVKSFAHFSGLLTAGEDGHVHWKVETKDFQGEARVMALAVKGKKFAGKGFPVRISDPLVLSPSLPRFLAPGDSFDLPLEVFNTTKKSHDVGLTVDVDGPAKMMQGPQAMALKAGDQQRVVLRGQAAMDAGVAVFTVRAKSEGLGEMKNATELAVRPGQPLRTDVKWGRLAPGETRSLAVPAGYIKYGRKVRVHVSTDPMVEYLGALDYLLRYPYGCAEQTASAAFPLLYLKDLGAFNDRFNLKKGQASEAEVAKYVAAAIRKLEGMQLENGAFVMWPGTLEARGSLRGGEAAGDGENGDGEHAADPGEGDNGGTAVDLQAQARANRNSVPLGDYLSDYISHFLLEADRLGHPVNETVLGRIKRRVGAIKAAAEQTGRLDRRAQNTQESSGTPYLLYLRALAGVPDVQMMDAMRQGPFKEHAPAPFDRYLLSLAYSAVGNAQAAGELLQGALPGPKLYREQGGRWDSSTRDLAAFMLAKADAGGSADELRPLMGELGKRMAEGHWGTTQDDAWALLALAKAAEKVREAQPLQASLQVGTDGAAFNLAGVRQTLSEPGFFGQTLTLKNNGLGDLRYLLMSEGTPLTAAPGEAGKGLKVGREYRDSEGKEVNLGSVAQGELVVVTVFVEAKQATQDLVLVDLLPAGFEVDNPRLRSQGQLGFEPESSLDPAYLDFRDDRVLIFPHTVSGRQAFSYSVRAVTPGTFTVPALLGEAMYDPAVFARWDPGTKLVIVPSRP